MTEILSALDCKLFKENASVREYWKNGPITIELIDCYQPTKLSFIEVEGPSNEAVQKVINQLGSLVKVAGDEIFKDFDSKK